MDNLLGVLGLLGLVGLVGPFVGRVGDLAAVRRDCGGRCAEIVVGDLPDVAQLHSLVGMSASTAGASAADAAVDSAAATGGTAEDGTAAVGSPADFADTPLAEPPTAADLEDVGSPSASTSAAAATAPTTAAPTIATPPDAPLAEPSTAASTSAATSAAVSGAAASGASSDFADALLAETPSAAAGPADSDFSGSVRTLLNVEGMTCAGCASKIESSLARLVGVEDASVNFGTRTALVTHAKELETEQLSKVVASLGYEVGSTAAGGGPAEDGTAAGGGPADFADTPLAEPPTAAALEDVGSASSAASPASSRVASNATRRALLRWVVSAPLAVFALVVSMVDSLQFTGWRWAIAGTATVVVWWGGWSLLRTAWLRLRHGSTAMDTLISLAALSAWSWSTVVLIGGLDANVFYDAAGMVVSVVLVGRWLETRSLAHSNDAVTRLAELISGQVRLASGQDIDISLLAVGDDFLVRPGERVATDAVVISGSASIDTAAITGEPLPLEVAAGDKVMGGTLNVSGALVVRALAPSSESTLAQILETLRVAQASRAPVQRMADRVSAVFVPTALVVALAALVGWLISGAGWEDAGLAAVAVLVVACPCALGLATPIALVVGTGQAARMGVLVKSVTVLEQTQQVDTVLFDKTGTLTEGRMYVVGVGSTAAVGGPAEDGTAAVGGPAEDGTAAVGGPAEDGTAATGGTADFADTPLAAPPTAADLEDAGLTSGTSSSAPAAADIEAAGLTSDSVPATASTAATAPTAADIEAAGLTSVSSSAAPTATTSAAAASSAGLGAGAMDVGGSSRGLRLDSGAGSSTGLRFGVSPDVDVAGAAGTAGRELLALAAAAESRSEHPIGAAIVAYAEGLQLELPPASDFDYQAGFGVTATVSGTQAGTVQAGATQAGAVQVSVGRAELFAEVPAAVAQASRQAQKNGNTAVLVGRNGCAEAVISVGDRLKPSAAAAIAKLRSQGMQVAMLSGDSEIVARLMAQKVGLIASDAADYVAGDAAGGGTSEVRADLKPADKLSYIEQLQAAGKTVAMVGDGINDAPALARADVSIAIGTGSDIAQDSSALTLIGNDLRAIPAAIALSRRILTTIRQNLAWAFSYNAVAIPLAAFGILLPVWGAVATACSSLLVVNNSLRLRRFAASDWLQTDEQTGGQLDEQTGGQTDGA